MLILALDTTSRAGSVAVVRDADVLIERAGSEAMTHGQRLPSELAATLDLAGVRAADLDGLAVAAGPGSFTGLRIGIATVQGLATACGLRIVPVSTLEAIARAASGRPARVFAWMDALRGEVYAQLFTRDGRGEVHAMGEAVAAPAAAVLAAPSGDMDGAEFHGDGARRYEAEIRAARGEAVVIGAPLPSLAGAIGLIAAAQPQRAVRPHDVVPIYVRRPDVEIARDRRAGTS